MEIFAQQIFSSSHSFSRTCSHTFIVQLFSSSADDLLSFFFCSLSFLSRAGVFFDLYSQLYVYVFRFDGAAYIQMDDNVDDDDMTKRNTERKRRKNPAVVVTAVERTRRINVQCKGQTNGCIRIYRERMKRSNTSTYVYAEFSFFFVLSMNND